MLIEFSVKNYRSFRDEAVLSMEANGSGTLKSVLIPFGGIQILPGVAIYGKNGGGIADMVEERGGGGQCEATAGPIAHGVLGRGAVHSDVFGASR